MIQRKCEDCEERSGEHTRFGVWLCPDCLKAFEEQALEREREKQEEIKAIVEGSRKPWEPSNAFSVYIKRVAQSGSPNISIAKQEDYFNAVEVPLIHLLTDEEVERIFEATKHRYFYLQSFLTMRRTDRFREAQVIKRQTKVEKTREKSEKQIEKQKKFASKDKSLSKEERGRAKVIEGLMAMGMSEEEAKRIAEGTK